MKMNMSRHIISWDFLLTADCDLSFTIQPGTFLDARIDKIPIEDFINKELILFSMADNIRSIPSMVDGLKPGQRKVIYGAFKKKITNEIKVHAIWIELAHFPSKRHWDLELNTSKIHVVHLSLLI